MASTRTRYFRGGTTSWGAFHTEQGPAANIWAAMRARKVFVMGWDAIGDRTRFLGVGIVLPTPESERYQPRLCPGFPLILCVDWRYTHLDSKGWPAPAVPTSKPGAAACAGSAAVDLSVDPSRVCRRIGKSPGVVAGLTRRLA